jgi:hypothetical protein
MSSYKNILKLAPGPFQESSMAQEKFPILTYSGLLDPAHTGRLSASAIAVIPIMTFFTQSPLNKQLC